MSFDNYYSKEGLDGILTDPKAYVAIAYVYRLQGLVGDIEGLSWDVVGDWSIRIKSEGGKTKLNINLMNLICYKDFPGRSRIYIPAKSTGVFQKELLDLLK